jgi:hypothetical protein
MFGEKKIKCRCPKCEVIHTQKMFWIGRGQPRIYCLSCRGTVSRMTGLVDICSTRSGRKSGPVFQS